MNSAPKSERFSKIYRLGVIVGCIALAVPLIGYVINGVMMRYSGDDYCYGATMTRFGFWKAQWVSYFQTQAYSGNRYSLTLFSDISGLFGPYMNGILPGLTIAIWLSGMIFCIFQLARFTRIGLWIWEVVFLAEFLIFFTLYLAPDLPQILYWRSGMLPYLAPLVTNTFLLGVILKQVQNKRANPLELGLIVLLAFLSAGFSETAAALQVGYLILLAVGAWFAHRRGVEVGLTNGETGGNCPDNNSGGDGCVGGIPIECGTVTKTSQPDLISFVAISLSSAKSFMLESIKSQPLPTVILFIFSVGIATVLVARTDLPERLNKRWWMIGAVLIPFVCYTLIVCCTAPSAYAQSGYPEQRVLVTARFVMIVAIVGLGWLVGMMITRWLSASPKMALPVRLVILFLLGILSVYPIYAARNIYRELPKYQRWVTFWDARDQGIRQAKRNGVMDVEVVKIDHIIPNVGELSADPGYWYNGCAAGYYGVNSIRADLPGWDK